MKCIDRINRINQAIAIRQAVERSGARMILLACGPCSLGMPKQMPGEELEAQIRAFKDELSEILRSGVEVV